eukprot:COSAG01_NODE_49857_length_368_cov_1.159851_1_plen_76_part_10
MVRAAQEFVEHQQAQGTAGKTPNDLYRNDAFVTRLTDADFDEKVREDWLSRAWAGQPLLPPPSAPAPPRHTPLKSC